MYALGIKVGSVGKSNPISLISIFFAIPILSVLGKRIESTPLIESTFSISGTFMRLLPVDINETSLIGPEAVVDIVEYVIVDNPVT